MKALIIDGQNNHTVWPKATIMMKQYLEQSGLFSVDIKRMRYTWRRQDVHAEWLPLADAGPIQDLPDPQVDPDFKPDFDQYDVVVNNLGNRVADWPEATQRAFESYVANGGGLVIVHAADNCWGNWPEYNKMIGIGGWGGRGEDAGPYIYYNDEGDLVRDDTSEGRAGKHGHQHELHMVLRDRDHPITKGLPAEWLAAKDECYAMMRGPAENMTILATAKDQTEAAPTDRHEPMLMTIAYGTGRVFHTMLGHDTPALEGVGFITTFLRGTEWAASGNVTIPIPDDFPTAEAATSRPFTYLGISDGS